MFALPCMFFVELNAVNLANETNYKYSVLP